MHADHKTTAEIRLEPFAEGDYDHLVREVDRWWGGREIHVLFPRLFAEHFASTSTVARAEGRDEPVGFLCGFRSQTVDAVAYIHMVGVDPDFRRDDLGARLYRWFFARAVELGCDTVHCVTAPINRTSRDFHAAMGFTEELSVGHDGPGEDRIVFTRSLS